MVKKSHDTLDEDDFGFTIADGKTRPSIALGTVTGYLDGYLETLIEFWNPLTGQREVRKVAEVVALGLIADAFRGDDRARKILLDRTDGKVQAEKGANNWKMVGSPHAQDLKMVDSLRKTMITSDSVM